MILTGERATQYFEQAYWKETQELVSMFTDPHKQPEIKGPELERRLRSIASRNDADSSVKFLGRFIHPELTAEEQKVKLELKYS